MHKIKKIFSLENTSIKREFLAGLSTFATMVYVTAINPSILSDAGMDFGAVLVATILSTVLATGLMGLLAHFPVAIAPGMGVSTYFAYSLVQHGGYKWEQMLGLCAIVALLLLILNILDIRRRIIAAIPHSLSLGITAGIGLFLMVIALKEVGAVQAGPVFIEIKTIWSADLLLLCIGTALIYGLLYFEINGSFILGILAMWAISLLFGRTVWQGIVSWPPSLKPTFLAFDFSSLFHLKMLRPLFSLFLVALFDSCAALIILARQARLVNEKGEILRAQKALYPDAIGSLMGSGIGSATLAIHLESAVGIQAGGRTGLTACVVAFLFLSCLFFYPLFASLPHFATAPVLIVLGGMMLKEGFGINWQDWTEWIPAAAAGIVMPLTLSIYNGFFVGFLTYAAAQIISGKRRKIHTLVALLSLAFLIELGSRLWILFC